MHVRLKLFALLIVALSVLGIVGWGPFIWPNAETKTNTITSSAVTLTSSQTTASTIQGSQTTAWIKVGQVKPVNYYLTLLESNGTQAYVQLAKELRKLPGPTNATAVAKITFLALNATNPEIKEAFQLMINGGTPDPRDFSYSVPSYNTELQVLYWLALQTEFKKDDTLALAIAMVNGLWVTMGDDQVSQAVRRDTNQMIAFGRETSEWQKAVGSPYNLEEYPLEAKIAWAWTGNTTPLRGPFDLQSFTNTRLSLRGYEWDTVQVGVLRSMRQEALKMGWFNRDLNQYVRNLEEYFWFNGPAWKNQNPHWNYSTGPAIIRNVDGVDVTYGAVLNVDFQFNERYAKGLRALGDCQAEAVFIDSWLKSVGGASTITWRTMAKDDPDAVRHNFAIYYDPISRKWLAYEKQTTMSIDPNPPNKLVDFWIYRPPVNQIHYLDEWDYSLWSKSNAFYLFPGIPYDEIMKVVRQGIPTSEMKQWLLYS